MPYKQAPPSHDYLKYWRVIRYYFKAKYGLTTADLDMLLFLNSEAYFTKDKFSEMDECLGWDKDRMNRLIRDKWIQLFRRATSERAALYELTYPCKRMLTSLYKKLNGEDIPTSVSQNPMMLKNVSYNDKVYRNMIKEINNFTKQQRHLAQ